MSTTSTDPIADMLSRIRNAIAVSKSEISMPHSKVKESVAKLLKDNRYVDSVNVEDARVGKTLKITINGPQKNSRITEIKRMSTPGRRYYASADQIPTVKRGRGVVIISTSKGMMTGAEAKKQGVGGELICKIY
ncbi:MAG TPA: 30S ribosomal protein S8 [Verrucomicrobiae bacterium]|nr:30S ribosomal protein S8 [Verrucomicrobiae bacterium]